MSPGRYAIAEHAKNEGERSTILVGYDTRFYSEEFSHSQ